MPIAADCGRGGYPGQRKFPTRGSYLTSEGSDQVWAHRRARYRYDKRAPTVNHSQGYFRSEFHLYLNCGRTAASSAGRIAGNAKMERRAYELFIAHLLYSGIADLGIFSDRFSGCAAI